MEEVFCNCSEAVTKDSLFYFSNVFLLFCNHSKLFLFRRKIKLGK